MPVRMRLATKGAARTQDVGVQLSRSRFLDRPDEQVDVVVEQRDVVVMSFSPRTGGRQDEDAGARFAAMEFGVLRSK